ncbi:MAG: VIT1/CCC1 transporter family protein [Planctomycetota bacterium]|nr:VIT1/CCC1 transporter family protein [Planctomycetota bacterium]
MSAVERWREEVQAAWIYREISTEERDPRRAKLFRELATKADEQAAILLGDVKRDQRDTPTFTPSTRAKVAVALTRRFGVERTRGVLSAVKVRGMSAIGPAPDAPGHAMPASVADIAEHHRSTGSGGSLRAAVFGVNDGLVSNASLILGVAGAGSDPRAVLLAGVAGLLAGAFSMAAGEWVSVRSQRELFEHQIGEEREELERYPDEEAEELALIYEARGVPLEDARAMTRKLVKDPKHALDTLAREELGLNPDNLGSPWGAASYSFVAFAIGASLPLLPFLFPVIDARVEAACVLSGTALFGVGAAISLFSGKNAWIGGLRMLLIGAAAGAATWGIGRLLGVAIA